MLKFADAQEISITDTLLTHSHHDHINGLQKTLEQSDAQVHYKIRESPYEAVSRSGAEITGFMWLEPLI